MLQTPVPPCSTRAVVLFFFIVSDWIWMEQQARMNYRTSIFHFKMPRKTPAFGGSPQIRRNESHVPVPLIVSRCDLFADDPGLAALPYHLKSKVSLSDFREFVSALEDTTVKVTNNNFKGLLELCEEFRFQDLRARLSQFRASEDLKKDTEAQIAIPMTEINHSGIP
jgi:hypothetical protein